MFWIVRQFLLGFFGTPRVLFQRLQLDVQRHLTEPLSELHWGTGRQKAPVQCLPQQDQCLKGRRNIMGDIIRKKPLGKLVFRERYRGTPA